MPNLIALSLPSKVWIKEQQREVNRRFEHDKKLPRVKAQIGVCYATGNIAPRLKKWHPDFPFPGGMGLNFNENGRKGRHKARYIKRQNEFLAKLRVIATGEA